MLAEVVAESSFFQVNLGNILSLAGMVVAMVIAWQKMSDKLDALAQQVETNENKLESIVALGLPHSVSAHAERLTRIERQTENLPGIATDVAWIKQALQRNSNGYSKQQ